MSLRIEVLSGLGGKAPAAILVEAKGKRLLLDAGGALHPGQSNEWAAGLDVDAVLITHDHIDHIGGVTALPGELPLYCTSPVAAALPPGRDWRPLPERGECRIAGIPVTTGQAGHSLGGVWLHLGVAGGVFYSGDACLESLLLPFDEPPPARVALLDASYGIYDVPQAQCREAIARRLSEPRVLPVPASGRALEMALWLDTLAPRLGITWDLDSVCRKGLEALLELPRSLRRVGGDAAIRQLLDAPRPTSPSLWLVADRDDDPHDWPAHRLLHTGYLTPRRQRQRVAGEVDWQRWNVHLRLSHLRALVRQLGARQVVPLFTTDVREVNELLMTPSGLMMATEGSDAAG
ncbi:MBL fold metallo-hydrolase [Billgrantia desiderata SP1]|uniref:MBL fold metallo-hydrolase n=1 Tax=Billgrantia desiderata TaxID=52021 RepID=A0ABS9B5F5_9GAMM|nr:MBL fold metallo-hydrolase [Halomonas desiderata]MCE8043050.1 MBL fold metallo-hydrolase [Halomonas desiderata]MCE8047434.1 MBL fold metallo-hydrolase [Halomonas desiderata]OUE38747.1 MBL fold metallo-hydrolase [Halomonas desiderata SP1]